MVVAVRDRQMHGTGAEGSECPAGNPSDAASANHRSGDRDSSQEAGTMTYNHSTATVACAALLLCACGNGDDTAPPQAAVYTSSVIVLDSDTNNAIAAGPDGVYVSEFGGGERCPTHHCLLRLRGDSVENVAGDAPPDVFENVESLALDSDGNIYAFSDETEKLIRWSPDSGETTEVPLELTSLDDVGDVAVTDSGDIYAYITGRPRTVALPNGAESPETIELERGGTLQLAGGRDGDVYLLDTYEPTVWKLVEGAWKELELNGFEWPQEITVGPDGSVYLLDCVSSVPDPGPKHCRSDNSGEREYRVLRYDDGGTTPAEIPVELTAMDSRSVSGGLAVADDGAIYVHNNDRVVVLTPA